MGQKNDSVHLDSVSQGCENSPRILRTAQLVSLRFGFLHPTVELYCGMCMPQKQRGLRAMDRERAEILCFNDDQVSQQKAQITQQQLTDLG